VHPKGADLLTLVPDGTKLISGKLGEVDMKKWGQPVPRTIKVFDMATGKNSQTFPVDDSGWDAIPITPDGKTMACWNDKERRLELWDLATEKMTRTCPAPSISGLTDGSFLADGKTLLLFSRTSKSEIHYWNTDGGNQTGIWSDPAFNKITDVALTPDGSILAAINESGALTVWDVQK
jgi:WD40 repeat protein